MVWEVARFRFPVEGATGSNMFQLPLTMAARARETRVVVKTRTLMDMTTPWRGEERRLPSEYYVLYVWYRSPPQEMVGDSKSKTST